MPFLKNKHDGVATGGVLVKHRQPDNPEENQEDIYDLKSAMEELASHLAAKDWESAAECFREAARMVDEEPHHEGKHIEPHTYESQSEE